MTGSDNFDLLIIGETYFDLIFAEVDAPPAAGSEVFARRFAVAGGGVFNTTAILARLGMRPALVTDLGNDFFSDALNDFYRREGIDDRLFNKYSRPHRMVTAAFSRGGDRGFLSYNENIDRAGADLQYPADIFERAAGVRLLHLPGLENGIAALALVRRAKARGLLITLDCQQTSLTLSDPRVVELLGLADIFIPNEPEALALCRATELGAAAEALGKIVGEVVIKRGAAGASRFLSSGERMDIEAISYGPAIDATGAGDAFNAGYIYGILKGAAPIDSLRAGAVCGGLAVSELSGTAGPTREKLKTEFERLFG